MYSLFHTLNLAVSSDFLGKQKYALSLFAKNEGRGLLLLPVPLQFSSPHALTLMPPCACTRPVSSSCCRVAPCPSSAPYQRANWKLQCELRTPALCPCLRHADTPGLQLRGALLIHLVQPGRRAAGQHWRL